MLLEELEGIEFSYPGSLFPPVEVGENTVPLVPLGLGVARDNIYASKEQASVESVPFF